MATPTAPMPRRRWLRRLLLWGAVGAAAALAIAVLLGARILRQAEQVRFVPSRAEHGELVMLGDLPVLELHGDPAQRGAAHGRLAAQPIAQLLALMRWSPSLVMAQGGDRFSRTLAAIGAEDRRELVALAEASGCDADQVIAANAIPDSWCSALVAGASGTRPLMVARNMDFFPELALGRATVLQIQRGAGPRTYASVGWPGTVGVISGINDAGLTVCVLLNHGGPDLPGAEPLPLRVRALLAHERDVAGALRRFAAPAVASPHYVLIADAATAAVAWHEPGGMRAAAMADGWLSASNGGRDGARASDVRGRRLDECIAACPADGPDAAGLRAALTASYLRQINAQAMLFVPARRRLELARAATSGAACLQPYLGLDLGPVLDGGPIAALRAEPIPAVAPLRHYRE